MQRLASRILIVVGVFVLVVAGLLVTRSRNVRTEASGPKPEAADLSIKEVRRNVVLTSDDGLRLETTVLRWRGSERRLWTDAPVKIIRENAVIHGTALDVNMDSEATTVKGRVNATFARKVGQ